MKESKVSSLQNESVGTGYPVACEDIIEFATHTIVDLPGRYSIGLHVKGPRSKLGIYMPCSRCGYCTANGIIFSRLYGDSPNYPKEMGWNCTISEQTYLDVYPVGFQTLEELTRYLIDGKLKYHAAYEDPTKNLLELIGILTEQGSL